MRRTIVAVALVVAASLTPVGVGTASAAPSPMTVAVTSDFVQQRGPAIWPTIRNHWWGQTIRFNKWQTASIAGGVGTIVGLTGTGGQIAVGFLGPAAGMAIERGACLQLNRSWAWPTPSYVPTWYGC